ncbi:MAG: hypothetical protein K6D54_05550, partial [Bacteroidales bacterium]|nr:hypothetical protein [Bacteroidales bacterium]
GGKSSLLCPQTSEKRHSGAKHAFYAPNRQKLAGMAHSRPIHLPTPGKAAEKTGFLWRKLFSTRKSVLHPIIIPYAPGTAMGLAGSP